MAVSAFFTDSTLCIGCKACEVACKEWNQIPEDGYNWTGHSYDNTIALGASTWRHVKFVEHDPQIGLGGNAAPLENSWVFSSDVCKHCENAGCLEACPTGAIVRMETEAVFVQPDVCNGCAYCVVSCPFGVIQKREGDGRAFKCTFCSDRQRAGEIPACAKACPTESIQFGELEQLRRHAAQRVEALHARGMTDAQLYDPTETSVGGIHAFFLIRGEPQTYNLPPKPEIPTIYLKPGWRAAGIGAAILALGSIVAFATERRA